MTRIKLFCFPYAGGSATIYQKWRRHLREEIDLIPVELPGRGKRISEDLYKDIPDAIDDVLRIIKPAIKEGPYALFGHSMGAMITYHLAQRIRETGLPQPIHLFLSGRGAPSVQRTDKKRYSLMDNGEFMDAVLKLGGTSADFFQYPELMELFFPLLRNDFRLSESEAAGDIFVPMDTNMTVLLGKDEDLTPEQCMGWKRHTRKICNLICFNGGHFFIHDATEKITTIINNTFLNEVFIF